MEFYVASAYRIAPSPTNINFKLVFSCYEDALDYSKSIGNEDTMECIYILFDGDWLETRRWLKCFGYNSKGQLLVTDTDHGRTDEIPLDDYIELSKYIEAFIKSHKSERTILGDIEKL